MEEAIGGGHVITTTAGSADRKEIPRADTPSTDSYLEKIQHVDPNHVEMQRNLKVSLFPL